MVVQGGLADLVDLVAVDLVGPAEMVGTKYQAERGVPQGMVDLPEMVDFQGFRTLMGTSRVALGGPGVYTLDGLTLTIAVIVGTQSAMVLAAVGANNT